MCGSEQGSASIPTNTNGDIGQERAHELARFQHATDQPPRQCEVLGDGTALKTTDRQTLDGITGSGHLLHLHLAFCTNEKELRSTLPLAHRVGDGDGWEDVTTGAATGDHHPKRVLFVGV